MKWSLVCEGMRVFVSVCLSVLVSYYVEVLVCLGGTSFTCLDTDSWSLLLIAKRQEHLCGTDTHFHTHSTADSLLCLKILKFTVFNQLQLMPLVHFLMVVLLCCATNNPPPAVKRIFLLLYLWTVILITPFPLPFPTHREVFGYIFKHVLKEIMEMCDSVGRVSARWQQRKGENLGRHVKEWYTINRKTRLEKCRRWWHLSLEFL